ncbi:MAG: TauD/TfdA family dioxygenase [Acidobacteria bacterium]|nr:MAG: TauD/TfdA family dioxygenase [Acidobacteriota bacterium]
MSITIEPLSSAIGAEIRGMDLRDTLSGDVVMQIIGAFYEHGVILFRNQELTEDQQLRFARYFGELGERSLPRDRWPEGADHNPKIMLISNIRKKGKPIGSLPDGELWFHHDMCYVQSPPKTTGRVDIEGDISKITHYFQPVAITHPVTKRKALYVNPLITARIEGLSRPESDSLLEELLRFKDDPEMVYEHVWHSGDLLVWDNLCSCHARTDFASTERRLLRRCTVLGEPLHE